MTVSAFLMAFFMATLALTLYFKQVEESNNDDVIYGNIGAYTVP